MQNKTPIAQSSFRITKENGISTESSISIFQPEEDAGTWKCQIVVEGILKPKYVHGDDSLQALCLAITLVRKVLSSKVVDNNWGLSDSSGHTDPQFLEYLFGY